MRNLKKNLFIALVVLTGLFISYHPASALQQRTVLTHLTTEDGLSQNTVVSVHKDRKGQLWFGTWDGLNKFDGYHFTVYKGNSDPADENSPLHTRVEEIKEDRFGFLWIKTYDDLLYRFDPSRESFLRVSATRNVGSETAYDRVSDWWVLDNGDVWCLLERGGSFKVSTDTVSKALLISKPLGSSNVSTLGRLNEVYLDKEGTTWILAEQGLARQRINEKEPVTVLGEKSASQQAGSRSFRVCLETTNALYFGGAHGSLWVYERAAGAFHEIRTPFTSAVFALHSLSENQLLVASAEQGFLLMDMDTEQRKHYTRMTHPAMRSDKLNGAFVDSQGDIWLSTDQPGVLRFQPDEERFTSLWLKTPNALRSTAQQTAFFVFEDALGTLWVHTREGTLFPFNRQTNSLDWFFNQPGDPDCVFKTNIQVAWADSEGVLWLCSGNQGIYKCVTRSRGFRFTSLESYIQSGTPDIRSLFKDPAGHTWVASKAGELRVFDPTGGSLGVLCSDGQLRPSGDLKLVVYDMLLDKENRLWLATKGQGLIRLTPRNTTYTAFEFTRFVHQPGDPYSLLNNNLYSLLQDGKGRLWIASYDGGLMLFNEELSNRPRFLHAGNDLLGYPMDLCARVRCLERDKQGNIWVGTTNGFLVFSETFTKPRELRFHYFSRDMATRNAMYSSDVYDICCDASGRVWLGTFGNGLMLCTDYTPGNRPELVTYNQKQGFHTDIVLGLVEDDTHHLWITSENTLARFNPETGNCDRYNRFNGLESGDFLEASVYKDDKGLLLFGNAAGFYTVDPGAIKRNLFAPRIVFTRLQLFGRDVPVGGKDSPLERHLDDVTTLKLTHKQRTFNVEFAALDYQTPENIQYEYKLDGFEEEWNTASKQRVATYTGLPRGDYRLLVRSTNSDGVWADNTRALNIKVLPSFWETIWAFILYIILGLLVVGLIVYLLIFFMRLKNEVLLEQKLSDLKLRFFTDISHELRTPLTLISAPIEHMLKHEDVSDGVKSQLQIVQRNTDRMTRLINQILDFRKVQNKKKRLQLKEAALSDLVRKSCGHFEEIAKEKNTVLSLEDESQGILVWMDENAIDTILFNLLSNAFKFTPAEKEIRVKLFATETEAVLQVIDQGVGIEKSKLPLIFERFYSADEGTEASKRSTGIGLSLTRELVNLHGGIINVSSEPGQGTTFEVRFKLGVSHFGKEVDFLLNDGVALPAANQPGCDEDGQESIPVGRDDSHMVLIVEDNEDLRPFLRTVLGRRYRVADAADGQTGWEMVQSLMPDFIITDLMLPGLSGADFIRLVKSDDRTCHIPVVVLTAKTNLETKLECLDLGADDYITKPFSATFLEARVANMIEQRVKLQSFFRERWLVNESKVDIEVPMPQAHSRDEEFMERLMSVMEKNISNGAFSVEQFCSMAGYGRTVFFNKLKSLTGLSPNEYIREVRIKRAAQLLEVGEYTVSQITYMVGMNDSRYFSKCFKQRYHMTPTEYREMLHK